MTLASCVEIRECPSVDPLAHLPQRLSETGLYADIASETLAADVVPFEPRFHLWSDGAEKRRWLSFPAGSVVDASDSADWRFPAGTKAWKEFTRDGVRVETRLIQKVGDADDDWAAVAYVW